MNSFRIQKDFCHVCVAEDATHRSSVDFMTVQTIQLQISLCKGHFGGRTFL